MYRYYVGLFTVILLVSCGTIPRGAPDWQLIYDDQDLQLQFYMDKNSITIDPGHTDIRSAHVLLSGAVFEGQPFGSMILESTISCNHKTGRDAYIYYYEQPMAQGEIVNQIINDSYDMHPINIEQDLATAAFIEKLCQY